MSYILDALRKAERERNLGQAPGLTDVAKAAPAPQQKKRPWLPAVLGATTLVLAAALLWSWLREPKAPATAAAPVVTLPAPTPPVADTATPDETPPPAIDDAASLATLDDLYPIAPDPGPAAPPPVSVPAPSSPPTIEIPAETPITDDPLPAGLPLAEAEAPAAPAPEPQAATSTLQLDPSPVPRPKQLKEMPASYRAEFPAIVIDVHVSNAEASKRFALINGRRYKENETLTEGPRIVEIPDGGIVFEYRGERVFYPLAH